MSMPPAVLVLAKPLDHEVLRGVADRSGGAVLVVDGNRSLGRVGDDPLRYDLNPIEPPTMSIPVIAPGYTFG